MQPISAMPDSLAVTITAVFADMDDTLTSGGRLPAHSYLALERLSAAGLAVVPVTGRPAGWCDMMARFWPIDGVVGENGAFYFSYDRAGQRMRRVFFAESGIREHNRKKLRQLQGEILSRVPGAAVSSDQHYREADLAIDVGEDVEALSRRDIDRIVAAFTSAGAVAKVSSIHVNGWFGHYDKLTMTRRFVTERLHADLDDIKERIIFCGDSPNDAPMFAYFPNACGVANVLDFEHSIDTLPHWIAERRGGAGFVEIANHILGARGR